MARSSTTRPKGSGIPAKGKGWGGQARGASASRIKPGDPDGIAARAHDPAVIADKAVAAEQMRNVLYGIALTGENDHARIAAADKLLDRLDGKAVQRQDVTSGGERIGYVIAAPAEAESVDEWAKDHAPK